MLPEPASDVTRILIVDDSTIVRGLLTTLIGEIEGLEVVGEAKDAVSAAESTHLLDPDVVILDIHMPHGSGLDALKGIKAMKPSPVVIMFSNYHDPVYRRIATENGADYFFDKSTEINGLVKVLSDLANRPREGTDSNSES